MLSMQIQSKRFLPYIKLDIKMKKNFELELNENSITEYLNKLDWSKPWNAGAQFSSNAFFQNAK